MGAGLSWPEFENPGSGAYRANRPLPLQSGDLSDIICLLGYLLLSLEGCGMCQKVMALLRLHSADLGLFSIGWNLSLTALGDPGLRFITPQNDWTWFSQETFRPDIQAPICQAHISEMLFPSPFLK